jgi:meiotically up-regulated gene 157 (Mug157) protein
MTGAHPDDWTASLLPDGALDVWEARVGRALPGSPVAAVFRGCLARTVRRSLTRLSDGRVAVITGDIPAMWLRDSSTQMWPYLTLVAEDPTGPLADALVGVARRQHELIAHDPYANAFQALPKPGDRHRRHRRDRWGEHPPDPSIWERKYEVDSLCFPFQLTARLFEVTGRRELLAGAFPAAAAAAVRTLRTEQDHESRSDYRFVRPGGGPLNTLARNGLGGPVGRTGLTWSGFRPSDDATTYGYNIPANLHAVAALRDLAVLAGQILPVSAGGWELAVDALDLAGELAAAVRRHGTAEIDGVGTVLAYEVDGLGHRLLMDDANLPNLLGLPLLAGVDRHDPVYRRTRAFVLSPANPTYASGRALAGLGSPHTRRGWVWPLALATQGLTTDRRDEQVGLLETLAATTAGTGHMHESVAADDQRRFSRPWFSWADAMFCQLVLTVVAPDEVVAPGPPPAGDLLGAPEPDGG